MRFQYRFQAAFPGHRSNKFCAGLQCAAFHTARLLSLCAATTENRTGQKWRAALSRGNCRVIALGTHFADAWNESSFSHELFALLLSLSG